MMFCIPSAFWIYSEGVCVPTCGTGVDHPRPWQLVLQVQHCFAHLGGRGVLGFVAFIKNNLHKVQGQGLTTQTVQT